MQLPSDTLFVVSNDNASLCTYRWIALGKRCMSTDVFISVGYVVLQAILD